MKYLIILSLLALTACNRAKQTAKDAVNKTGETIGQAGSEFVDGVSKGVEKTFQSEVKISEAIKNQQVSVGKILITSSAGAADNILSAYLIFDKDFDTTITAKVFTEKGQEYGRVTQRVAAKQNEARYVDFVFDTRTNIDGRGVVSFE